LAFLLPERINAIFVLRSKIYEWRNILRRFRQALFVAHAHNRLSLTMELTKNDVQHLINYLEGSSRSSTCCSRYSGAGSRGLSPATHGGCSSGSGVLGGAMDMFTSCNRRRVVEFAIGVGAVRSSRLFRTSHPPC